MKKESKSIQCYDLQAWSRYHAGLFTAAERLVMEEHLLTCDRCLTIYLDLVEQSMGNEPDLSLDDSFADSVLQTIVKEETAAKSAPLAGRAKILISYCAAASIALFFWGGGYFASLAQGVTNTMEHLNRVEITQPISEPQRRIIQTGWTDKVVQENRTSVIDSLLSKRD